MNKFYIYCFYNYDWNEPFYLGKGSGNRYRDMSKRNKQVKAIFEKYKCKSRIIKSNLSEMEAYEAEKNLKEILKNNGKPIIDAEDEVRRFNQRVGIEKAKAEGKYKGRKALNLKNDMELQKIFYTTRQEYLQKKINKTEWAKQLGISRPTLDKLINEYEFCN